MKKIVIAIVICISGLCFARGPVGHNGPAQRPCPPPQQRGPAMYHHSGWGRGGRNVWPSFTGAVAGAIVGNAIANSYRPATVVQPAVIAQTTVVQPTVVTQPVVVQQPVVTQPIAGRVTNVWVPGRYVNQVQPNGFVYRVWQPGHYEQVPY